MCTFDYNDTEAAHLEDMYIGFEGRMNFEEEIAEAEYQRANTLATLLGLDDGCYTHQRKKGKSRKKAIERKVQSNKEKQKKQNEGLFVVIQDSRKDDTTLMLVDRRKSKQYWWTHDFSLAYKGCKDDMDKVAGRLKKNNVRVVNYNEYLASV